eukprot:EG_transcript_18320
MLLCNLCGQGFGSRSLAIHQPQCYRKKLAQWEVGDLHIRGPRPVEPRPLNRSANKRVVVSELDAGLFEGQSANVGGALAQCPHCQGRYSPQVLRQHLPLCDAAHCSRPCSSGAARPKQSAARGKPASAQRAEAFAAPPVELSGLIPCRKCGRRFVGDRIAIHERACLGMKARKKFNSNRQRLQGLGVSPARQSGRPESRPTNAWRQKHAEFQQALRYSRMMTKASATGVSLAALPPPPPSSNPDYVPCPYCQRRFNPAAAERHIPSCATTLNRPKPPPHARARSPAVLAQMVAQRSSLPSPSRVQQQPTERRGSGPGRQPPSAVRRPRSSLVADP